MSKSERKRRYISYRNKEIPVDKDGYATIGNERYLVVETVDQEFITKYFKETKEHFKSLDDISKSKKYLDERCVFDCEIHSLNDYLDDDSDLLIFRNSIFLKEIIKRDLCVIHNFSFSFQLLQFFKKDFLKLFIFSIKT